MSVRSPRGAALSVMAGAAILALLASAAPFASGAGVDAGVAGRIATTAATSAGPDDAGRASTAAHVLLLSVDGLHQSDLTWYAHTHPASALAALLRGGTNYSHALTPVPSDSFPGMIAQVTGGNPKTTGVYYDDS